MKLWQRTLAAATLVGAASAFAPQAAVAQDRRKVVRKPLRVEPPSKDEQRP